MSEEQNSTISQQDYDKQVERAQRFEGQLRTLEEKLKGFEGIDPVKYKAIVEDYDNLRKEKATGSKEEVEKLLSDKEKELRNSYQSELDGWKDKFTDASKRLHELTVVDKVMGQIGPRFNDDVHDFIKEAIRREIDVDESGNFFVKNGDGKPVHSKTEPAKQKSIAEWAEEFGAKHPSFAKSTASGGGFNKTAQTNGTAANDLERRYLDAAKRGTLNEMPAEDRQKAATSIMQNFKITK